MGDLDVERLSRSAWRAHRDGRHRDALTLLDEAISSTTCKSIKSALLATKGGFLRRSGDCERAVEACLQAVEYEARNIYALSQLGIARLELMDYAEACIALQEVVRLRPDCNTWTLLATAQLPIDPQSALVSANEALRIDPTWADAREVLDAASAAGDGVH